MERFRRKGSFRQKPTNLKEQNGVYKDSTADILRAPRTLNLKKEGSVTNVDYNEPSSKEKENKERSRTFTDEERTRRKRERERQRRKDEEIERYKFYCEEINKRLERNRQNPRTPETPEEHARARRMEAFINKFEYKYLYIPLGERIYALSKRKGAELTQEEYGAVYDTTSDKFEKLISVSRSEGQKLDKAQTLSIKEKDQRRLERGKRYNQKQRNLREERKKQQQESIQIFPPPAKK